MVSGLIATFVFLATSLAIRAALGVGTVIELAGDRTAPFLGIPLFFRMLGAAGSYSHLKEFGVVSILLGEIGCGMLLGLIYGMVVMKQGTKLAQRAVAALVAVGTAVLMLALWPTFATNYDGLPPGRATLATAVTFVILSAVFVAVLFWSEARKSQTAAAPGEVEQRRSLIAGSVGAVAALVSTIFLVHFYRIASYTYDGTVNAGDDLPPITPNDAFYQVTKNQVDPQPTLADWRLEVTGSVARSALLQRRDLDNLPAIVQETTLQCISDPMDGGLNSNAKWKGVPLHMVLAQAGLSAGTRQIMFHGADGFVDDIPIEKALNPTTLLVFEMNGETLPQRHGFPVRLIVPGYVGEKSVKWLTKIEAREVPGKGFYEQQGWGPQFTINDGSRFDTDFSDDLRVGQRTVLKGTAFAGDRGVATVEVSIDDGDTWKEAEITYRGSDLAWVQWRFPWQPERAGDVMLAVRCTDKQGGTQSSTSKPPAPNPASGYGRASVKVNA